MTEEMLIENDSWESDEVEDSESDEVIVEAEDSAEDIGEARRRRIAFGPGRRAFGPSRTAFRSGRGVGGMVVRGQDGRVRRVPFPTKLATAVETNRGLAKQEVARRGLEAQLDRLEARFRVQQKNDSAASGLVYLVIGGGLATYGAIQVGNKGDGFLGNWAKESSTRVATFASVTQIATSGAKLAINGQYHRSGVGIAADIVAAAQIVTFAIGSFYTTAEKRAVDNKGAAVAAMQGVPEGTLFLTRDTSEAFRVEIDVGNNRVLRRVS